jgi:Na+-driven multidrug efflux pump
MFPLVGFQIVITNFFQSIGFASKAIFLSLTRQVIILIPLLFFLPKFYGITGVWLSMPSADFISTLIAIVFYVVQVKKMNATGLKKTEE